ncbi:MAG: hypothetical protein JWN31_677 [Frankiales bacterium]|nr:hypothetical protein [Frankiales bacterium]
MALQPVGPLPAATYWRRRAGLLLAVIAVLFLGKSCLGGGGGGGTPKAHTTPTPSSSPSTAATGAASTVCADSALKAEASTDEPTYALGSTPKMTLAITNTSKTACARDMGSGAIEFVVFSGEDRVWSSDDCGTGRAASVVTLAPGARKVVTITWAGKRSKPNCAGSHDDAKPGTYRVVGRAGTLHSSGAVFRFHA